MNTHEEQKERAEQTRSLGTFSQSWYLLCGWHW
jgi:hypothetical protein